MENGSTAAAARELTARQADSERLLLRQELSGVHRRDVLQASSFGRSC
jgi:hypothetical protein